MVGQAWCYCQEKSCGHKKKLLFHLIWFQEERRWFCIEILHSAMFRKPSVNICQSMCDERGRSVPFITMLYCLCVLYAVTFWAAKLCMHAGEFGCSKNGQIKLYIKSERNGSVLLSALTSAATVSMSG